MIRHLQSLVIVLFFFAMMALLIRDHLIPSLSRGRGIQIDRAVLTDSWVNVDDYMEIRFGNMTVGAIRNTTDLDARVEGEPETYTATTHVEIDAGGLLRARVMTVAKMNRRLEVEAARVRAHMPSFGQPLHSPDVLDGEELPAGAYELLARIDGTQLRYRLMSGDAVKYEERRLARPVTMIDSIAPILRGQMMTKNIVYNIDIIDPLGGESMATNVEIEWVDNASETFGEDLLDLRVVELRYGQLKSTMLVDGMGTIMRREIPLLPAGAGSLSVGPTGASLVFERLEPQDATERYPQLRHHAEMEEVDPDDVQGESRGEISGLNLFSMIGGAR